MMLWQAAGLEPARKRLADPAQSRPSEPNGEMLESLLGQRQTGELAESRHVRTEATKTAVDLYEVADLIRGGKNKG